MPQLIFSGLAASHSYSPPAIKGCCGPNITVGYPTDSGARVEKHLTSHELRMRWGYCLWTPVTCQPAPNVGQLTKQARRSCFARGFPDLCPYTNYTKYNYRILPDFFIHDSCFVYSSLLRSSFLDKHAIVYAEACFIKVSKGPFRA